MSRFTVDSARAFLYAADVFYDSLGDDHDPNEDGKRQTLNMNDTWGWALAWGEEVPDDKLIEAAELFWSYGWSGLLYWMSCRHDNMESEFFDNNRAIEFVRNEERIRAEHPGSSACAYHQESYLIGIPKPSGPALSGKSSTGET